MNLQLYNTESRKKETLIPLQKGLIRMYTCGPTIYNFAHIGNFRTYVFEDILRRTIQYFGMQVEQVMNLTDVDDKTIKSAVEQDLSIEEFTKPFKEAFFQDLHTLHIEPAEHYPAATDFIPEMIAVIQDLLAKGVAYRGGDGSIYYAIRTFHRYGCLSHLHLDELQAGASERISADEYEKENASDFVLWKTYDPDRDGKIFWESPYGPGRPGWHLECSTMAMKLLGPTIDVHVGGIDNMFPHHENEIAQSEAFSGQQFVKIWMHSEHLIVDQKKMSKSLGNFYTLRDLLKRGYSGTQIRYMLLQTHYKTPLNFTFSGLDAAKGSLERLQDFIYRLQKIEGAPTAAALVDALVAQASQAFRDSLGDDLNISSALAVLFDLVRQVNALCDEEKVGCREANAVLALLKKFNQVLAVLIFELPEQQIPQELQEALEKRIEARKQKDWALADSLRDYISNQGYLIEDSAAGARLKLKPNLPPKSWL